METVACAGNAGREWNRLYSSMLAREKLLGAYLPKQLEFDQDEAQLVIMDLAEELFPGFAAVARMQLVGYMETAIQLVERRFYRKYENRHGSPRQRVTEFLSRDIDRDDGKDDFYSLRYIRSTFTWMNEVNIKRSICRGILYSFRGKA